MVYKNGEYVKTVSLVGSGLPVSTTSYSVTGLPEAYWPPGTIRSWDANHPGRRYHNRDASYHMSWLRSQCTKRPMWHTSQARRRL